jgi:hypothetical protein
VIKVKGQKAKVKGEVKGTRPSAVLDVCLETYTWAFVFAFAL